MTLEADRFLDELSAATFTPGQEQAIQQRVDRHLDRLEQAIKWVHTHPTATCWHVNDRGHVQEVAEQDFLGACSFMLESLKWALDAYDGAMDLLRHGQKEPSEWKATDPTLLCLCNSRDESWYGNMGTDVWASRPDEAEPYVYIQRVWGPGPYGEGGPDLDYVAIKVSFLRSMLAQLKTMTPVEVEKHQDDYHKRQQKDFWQRIEERDRQRKKYEEECKAEGKQPMQFSEWVSEYWRSQRERDLVEKGENQ